jgi:hypothetical protein
VRGICINNKNVLNITTRYMFFKYIGISNVHYPQSAAAQTKYSNINDCEPQKLGFSWHNVSSSLLFLFAAISHSAPRPVDYKSALIYGASNRS